MAADPIFEALDDVIDAAFGSRQEQLAKACFAAMQEEEAVKPKRRALRASIERDRAIRLQKRTEEIVERLRARAAVSSAEKAKLLIELAFEIEETYLGDRP